MAQMIPLLSVVKIACCRSLALFRGVQQLRWMLKMGCNYPAQPARCCLARYAQGNLHTGLQVFRAELLTESGIDLQLDPA